MADAIATDDASSYRDFTIGRVLSRSFDIFLKHIVNFTLITIVVSIPAMFAPWILLRVVDTSQWAPDRVIGLTAIAQGVLYLFLAPLAIAVILYGSFQHLRGHPVRLGEMVSRGLARTLPLIGLMILETLGIILGMFLLIVPGFIFAVMWYVAVPVCVVEKTSPIRSLTRSQELTRGFRWKLFGLFLLVLIANTVGGKILESIVAAVGGGLDGFWVHTGTVLIWHGLTQAFGSVLIVVAYYYLRVAKEGMDIEGIAAVFD